MYPGPFSMATDAYGKTVCFPALLHINSILSSSNDLILAKDSSRYPAFLILFGARQERFFYCNTNTAHFATRLFHYVAKSQSRTAILQCYSNFPTRLFSYIILSARRIVSSTEPSSSASYTAIPMATRGCSHFFPDATMAFLFSESN